MSNLINRKDAIDVARKCPVKEVTPAYMLIDKSEMITALMLIPSAEPDPEWRKKHYEMAYNHGYVDACKHYENLPERKKGKWVGKERFVDSTEFYSWQCSVCGCVLEDPTFDKPYPFCPNCGAGMRGEQDEID